MSLRLTTVLFECYLQIWDFDLFCYFVVFSHDGLSWVQLPEADETEKAYVKSIFQRFTGTPSNEFKVQLPNQDEGEVSI